MSGLYQASTLSMAEAPLLHVADLLCGHAERSLFQPINFTLKPGQAMQVVGANGQGKTTLFRAVAGLGRPLAGAITWQGADELSQDMIFIGHDNALNIALTPVENLELLLRLGGHGAAQGKIRETLALLGLKHVVNRPCGRLSAGQRRRVALARLWLRDARIWLLDEPAAALDVDARAVLCAHMAEFLRHGGMVLFTTHEPLSVPDVTPTQLVLQPC